MPEVSIIIPYYKKKFYFQKTLNSILKQSFQKFEVIIIYDDLNKNELGGFAPGPSCGVMAAYGCYRSCAPILCSVYIKDVPLSGQ